MGNEAQSDAEADPGARFAAQVAAGEFADSDDAAVARRFIDGLEVTRGPVRPPLQSLSLARPAGQIPSALLGATPIGFAPLGQPVGANATIAALGHDLQTPTEVELPQQIIRGIRLQWNQGVSEARLRLTPQHLGEIHVSLRVENGVVRADLQASTAEVRNWIRGHEAELRRTLGEQGLDLEQLTVLEESDRHDRREDANAERQSQRAPRRPPENAPRFEVHV